MATVQNILDDIDARLPNPSFTYAQRAGWINDITRRIYRYANNEGFDDIVVSSSMVYELTTDCRMTDIERVYVSDATSIASITSTNKWAEYKYAGRDDVLVGSQYFAPNNDYFPTTSFTSVITFYPATTEIIVARYYYNKRPTMVQTTSSGSTDVLLIDDDYISIYKYGLMSITAKSGNSPDIELANNYELEYREEMKRIKMDYALKKLKRPKEVFSYQEWKW